MDKNIEETILKLAEPLLNANGLVLWGLEVQNTPVIRVCLYVDVLDGSDGDYSASIEQCEAISRQLGLALEVEDCFPRKWVLEVSSPGLDRIFFTLSQMSPYRGDMVEARLSGPLPASDRKTWRGVLREVGEQSFELLPAQITAEGEIVPEGADPVVIPWELARRVRRVPVFRLPAKPGKKAGNRAPGKNK